MGPSFPQNVRSCLLPLRKYSPLPFWIRKLFPLVSADFYSDFDITWGNDRAKVLDNGQHLQLTFDQSSGIFYLICLLLLYMCVYACSLHHDPNLLVCLCCVETGSGFQFKNEYLFGKIDMQIKLVLGNSTGTVTAYYVSLPLQLMFCPVLFRCVNLSMA